MNWPGPEQECAALAESGQHLEVGAFFLLAGLGNLWETGGAQQIRPPLVPPLIPLDPAAAGQTPSSVAFGPPGWRPRFFDLPAVHSYCHCFGPPDLINRLEGQLALRQGRGPTVLDVLTRATSRYPDEDIFEPHIRLPAGVQLQRDGAVVHLIHRVGEVDHLHAVQPRAMVVAHHGQHIIVPLRGLDRELVLGRRPHDPAAPRGVDAAGMMVQVAVDLELVSLGDVGGTGLEAGAVEDAAIAAGHALETDGQLEIFVVLFGHQVTVAFGDAHAVNRAVFHGPLLAAHLHPAGEVLAVEKRNPALLRLFQAGLLGGRGHCESRGQRQGRNQAAHVHAPISLRMAVAIRSVNSSTRARSGPSTITRASGSVPAKRTSTRPAEPNSCWHSSISRATAASSWSARLSRTRTFCKRCG